MGDALRLGAGGRWCGDLNKHAVVRPRLLDGRDVKLPSWRKVLAAHLTFKRRAGLAAFRDVGTYSPMNRGRWAWRQQRAYRSRSADHQYVGAGRAGEPAQPFPALAEVGILLVGENANQDHRSAHRKVERRRDAQQVDEVLKHLEQNRPRTTPTIEPSPPRNEKPPRTAAAMAYSS